MRYLYKITFFKKNIIMVTKDKDMQDYFRKKLRIALLGEPSMMTQAQVTKLCEKFFDYGLEYEKKS